MAKAKDEFQMLKAAIGGFYWHLKARNSEIVCSSQVYTTKEACIRGACWVKNNAADAKVYDYTAT